MTIDPLFLPSRRAIIGGVGVAALVGIGNSPMRNLIIRRRDTITLDERGASIAGLRAAMRELQDSGGGTLRIRTPILRINTVELNATGSVALPGSVTIEGEGASVLFTGSAAAPPLLLARDVSQVAIRNLASRGNGRGIADTRSGGFMSFELSAAATADMEDLRVENVSLAGFGGERWIQFLQRNEAGRRMTGLSIVDLRARSGTSPTPAKIGVSAAPLWIHGDRGEVRDVRIVRPVIDASGVKQGVVLFHKVRGVVIDTAEITGAGLRGASDDAGAYAILAYGDRGEMGDIAILRPRIDKPRSAGIYLRGTDGVRITDPVISGQSDRRSENLPKGAIALNGSSAVSITGGRLTGNVFDLSVADGGVNDLGLEVTNLTTSGSETSVILAISPGRGAIAGARFSGCDLSGIRRVFRVMNEQIPGRYYDDVSLIGGRFGSPTAPNIIELTQGAPTMATGYLLESLSIQTNYVGIMCAGFLGGLQLRAITISSLGRLNYGIVADDCPRIDWDGITFRDMPAGYGYAARSIGTRVGGAIRNVRFQAVANAAMPGSLTRSAP